MIAVTATTAQDSVRPHLARNTAEASPIKTLVGGLGSGPVEMEEVRRVRLRAEEKAREEAVALLGALRTGLGTSSPRARDLVLSQAVFWLPHVSREFATMWQGRPSPEYDDPMLLTVGLLADDCLRRSHPENVGEPSLEALNRLVGIIEKEDLEAWDPLPAVFLIHAFLRLTGSLHTGPGWIPDACSDKVEELLGRLEQLLISGKYRRRGGIADSPHLLLCAVSELWRQNVVQAARLRAPLEEAIRWELQVDAADTILAESALIIAAENLHMRGVDPRVQRRGLMDSLEEMAVKKVTTGRRRPGLLRHPDGRIFSGSPLIAQILLIRALVGQPRSSGAELFPRQAL